MFKFRTQIIALILIIGSQRSLASPTSIAHPLGVRTLITEASKEYDAPQTIDVPETGGRGQEHNWDCQAESDYVQKQIALTTKMLGDGDKVIREQRQDLSSADGTVLVLGKGGSGKTSLIQFLTQNPKLQSKKVSADTGEYIFEDGEKIGTSATESFTLYPELVNYKYTGSGNNSINFLDSPGFHDSRSSAHEIVSMDVMKSVTRTFKKVKILLLENYSSLQYGFSKESFIITLRHLNDFLIDIDRFKDNIVLIATKIPFNYYKMADDDGGDAMPKLITEEMHIESIMKYLNYTEASLAKKLTHTQDISKTDKEFYQKIIRLLQSLQTRDGNGKATRISVFRRPYKMGPVKNMPLLEIENRGLLFDTFMNLDFVEVRENDFDFTLSDKAKLYLECLLKLTSDNYKSKINEVSFKLNDFVSKRIQNYTSFYQVLSELESLHDALEQLSENLYETRNYNEFFEKIHGFMTDQEIPMSINYNETMNVLEKYEEMLSKFVNTSAVFIPSSWTHPIRRVIRVTKDELQWYRTLKKFIGGLSGYERQKNKTEIYSTVFHEGTTLTNNLMTLFMDATGSTDLKQFIDALSDTKKRSEVETIPRTLLIQNNVTCDVDGKLIVKGFHVILSEINTDNLMRSYCNNITVKEIALLAVDTVFLDEDTIDIFRGVNMFIAAPKWEVIGQRKIVLSGQPGPPWWSDDHPHVNNGKNGKPGLPGSNGGSFFGIGLQFLNGRSLYIESNGGRGGPGTDGAKGARGLNGRNAEEKLKFGIYNQSYKFEKGFKTNSLSESLSQQLNEVDFKLLECNDWPVTAKIQVVIEDGDCGSNGGSGGFGGEAGIGGLPGDQQLIELGDSSQIKMQNQNGTIGRRGSMGVAGDSGTHGIGMICINLEEHHEDYFNYYNKYFWKCKSTNSTSPACKKWPIIDQTVEYQYTSTGIEKPAPRKSPDFIHYLLDYAALLEAYNNNKVFNKMITDFEVAIQKKFSYNLYEMGLLCFKKSA